MLPGGIGLAAQLIDQQRPLAIHECGGDRFHIVTDEHHDIRSQLLDSHYVHPHGVALGLAPLVDDDLRQGRLVKPLGLGLENAYAFWLIRRDVSQQRPEVEAFCHWLRQEQRQLSGAPC